jgi:hypothetical protein
LLESAKYSKIRADAFGRTQITNQDIDRMMICIGVKTSRQPGQNRAGRDVSYRRDLGPV